MKTSRRAFFKAAAVVLAMGMGGLSGCASLEKGGNAIVSPIAALSDSLNNGADSLRGVGDPNGSSGPSSGNFVFR